MSYLLRDATIHTWHLPSHSYLFETYQCPEDLIRVSKEDEGTSCLLDHTSSFRHLRHLLGDPAKESAPATPRLKSEERTFQRVDLMGRLSNPPEATKILILQGSTTFNKHNVALCGATKQPIDDELVVPTEEEGRLSNPVQRRLTDANIGQLVEDYVGGLSVNALARRFGIHRTTVMNHLESRGVQRRRNVRKLSATKVALAAGRYANGLSLASVAKEFGVSEATLTREFHAAGIPIKPRRGWS